MLGHHPRGRAPGGRFAPVALAALVFASLAPRAASADLVTFDFEAQTPTWNHPLGSRPGALNALMLTEAGLTATVTREGNRRFDVVRNVVAPADQLKASAFGLSSLDPFFDFKAGAFLIDFSTPIAKASVEMGDYGGDTDTLLLQAYSGAGATGMLLASQSLLLAGGGDTYSFLTLSVASDAPIASLRLIGGVKNFGNSVFYDNLQVESIPEPASVVALTIGMLGMGASRLRGRGRAWAWASAIFGANRDRGSGGGRRGR